jgi:hypothetical protein
VARDTLLGISKKNNLNPKLSGEVMRRIVRTFLAGMILALYFMSVAHAQGLWSIREPMPTARWGLGAAEANGNIYAIGGSYVGVNALSIVEEYNPLTNSWGTKTPMTNARNGVAVAALNGKIYAIGGGGSSWNTNIVEEYDPVLDAWINRQPMQIARWGLTAAAVNGKIYAIGGTDGSNALNIVEEYDPISDTWTTKTPMLTAREWLASAVIDGKIYVIGGMLLDHYATNAVEIYNPLADTWATAQSMPTPRGGLSAAALNGNIYAIGGSAGFPLEDDTSLNIVEEYDVISENWRTAQSMSIERTEIAVAVVNGLIFAIGGTQNTYQAFDIVEAYDPYEQLEKDTLYIPHLITCLGGDSSFIVPLRMTCQTATASMNIPLEWDDNHMNLDSVSYVGSAVENWDYKEAAIDNVAHNVRLGLLTTGENYIQSGWDTTIAYLYFSLQKEAEMPCYLDVTFDTTFSDDPEKCLLFADISNPPSGFVPEINFEPARIGTYIPGDVNNDGKRNLLDVSYIINYLYRHGVTPHCLDAADVKGDCNINLLDISYFINYMYRFGPAPKCGCAESGSPVAGCCGNEIMPEKINPSATITTSYSDGKTTIAIKSPVDIYGLELVMTSGQNSPIEITNKMQNMQVYSDQSGNDIAMAMLDLHGIGIISRGERVVLEVNGPVSIISALGANESADAIAFSITNNDNVSSLPREFILDQNHPNPFNPITVIGFALPLACDVSLDIFNIAGQKVASLVNGMLEAGNHNIEWDSRGSDGQPLASGIYFYRLRAGEFVDTKKMMLLK